MWLTVSAFVLILGSLPVIAYLDLAVGVCALVVGAFLYGVSTGRAEAKVLREALERERERARTAAPLRAITSSASFFPTDRADAPNYNRHHNNYSDPRGRR